MFTEKDLIAGETVLVSKNDPSDKRLYLGSAGLVYFISATNKYKLTGGFYTIEELNESFTIEQPKSKVVPLEKKVYDFVPVRASNDEKYEWQNAFLIAVVPEAKYPYIVINGDRMFKRLRHCEFLNEQSNERNT